MMKKIVAVAAAGLMSFAATSGVAGPGDSMKDFFDDGMGSVNITGPSANQGQAAGYYTGGNLVYRAPQETTQIASIQLPSVRAGCGGIDIFSGGFSFISSEQLIAHMKAIASAAPGYAFSLALTQLSPILADKIDQMQTYAQKINEYNMNSCEQAQALVDGAGKLLKVQQHACEFIKTKEGGAATRLAAKWKCGSGGETGSTLASARPENKPYVPVNKNLAWEAIKNNPSLSGDSDLQQFLMTLTGTIVVRCPTSPDAGCNYSYFTAQVQDAGVITSLMDGGPVTAHSCASDMTTCLTPTQFGRTFTIRPEHAMKARVSAMLVSIVRTIRNRQALSVEQQRFLSMVSLPVGKMASVYAAHQGPFAEGAIAQYADVIAIDLVNAWLAEGVRAVQEGTRNMKGMDPLSMKEWLDSTAVVQGHLMVAATNVQVKANTITTIVSNTSQIEQILAAKVGSRMADAVAFSAGLSPK